MLDIETIYNGPGPFPLKGSFTTDIDGPVLMLVSGTAYSTAQNVAIGFQVNVEDILVANAVLFTNEQDSHKALVSGVASTVYLKPGTYSFTITPFSGETICDQNDFATISLWPLPDLPFAWNFNGSLPQYTTMNSQVSGQALVFIHGSAWSSSNAQSLGLYVVIDGNPVVTTQAWTTLVNSHMAVPAMMAPVTLSPGQHKIGVSMTTGSFQTDANDYYTVAVIY